MIDNLQQSARNAVNAMGSSVERANTTVGHVEAAGHAFDTIVESMNAIFDMSSQIAGAAEQQNATTNEIASNVNNIADIAERTAANAVEASERSHSLAGLADRLQNQVSHFTVDDA